MTGHELQCRCQMDLIAEWQQLAGWLPAGLPGDASPTAGQPPSCEVLEWASSGLMHLTGATVPVAPPVPVLGRAALVAEAIKLLAGLHGMRLQLSLRSVLTSRAGERGFRRQGTVSANGSCRLLPAADGWLAVNLARDTDVRSLPAMLGRDLDEDPWTELSAHAAASSAADVAAAAQLLGIPAAVLGSEQAKPVGIRRAGEGGDAPRFVLDLSAMWAGPLCAQVLRQAGCRVLKVEDARRPDGARFGPRRFYSDLHAGIPAVQLDFGSVTGRSELARLASQAGIVVESSRPRAVRGLGLIAEEWLTAAPGRVWVSITGYGRDDPRQRVAFGDDAAVAGGLACQLADGTPVFCGDAVADPLTGLHAALAVLAAQAAGGGYLVDAAMASVSATVARPAPGPGFPHTVTRTRDGWRVSHGSRSGLVLPP